MQPTEKIQKELEYFEVDPHNGFLPAEDPPLRLGENYAAWDDLATHLSDYLNASVHRRKIESLPLIENPVFESKAELERAMLLLCYFAHAYINGPGKPTKILPESISVPWVDMGLQLGRPPIINHSSSVLNNWRRLDDSRPLALDNIAPIMQFHGGLDESWFFMVTVFIEKTGAPAIPLLLELVELALNNELELANEHLVQLVPIVEKMKMALLRMYENCDPHIFFHRIRPFLASFESVHYQGVTPEVRNYHGGSAAQSSLLQLFDCALQMDYSHRPSTQNYLLEMRKYMPPKHSELLYHIEKKSRIREQIQNHPPLKEAYRELINNLIEFRQEHLKIVGLYIMKQAKASGASSLGTGGTNPMIFLKSIKNRNEELKE